MTKKQAKIFLIAAIVNVILIISLLVFINIKKNELREEKEKEAMANTTQEPTTTATETETETETEEVTESQEELLMKSVEEEIMQMTIEEKVGQMFFVKASPYYDQSVFDTYQPGGVILFGSDVDNKTADELRAYIENFQSYSRYPLFIGIDEEGGTVSRISSNSYLVDEPFYSPRYIYEQGGFKAVIEDSHNKSQLLKSLGFNMNFAPVVDYSVDSGDYMYRRAFGSNIDETCEFATLITYAMRSDKMGSVLKHFPGYGNNGDTHSSIITDYRDYETFVQQDFRPFEAGIKAGADFVLVSHNIVVSMDDSMPASLSKNVHDILRNELGFEGVIVTDDLAMSGVSDFVSSDKAAVEAVRAGNDMVLVTDYEVQFEAVVAAVKDGTISEDQIDMSVKRILLCKYKLGIIDDLGTY